MSAEWAQGEKLEKIDLHSKISHFENCYCCGMKVNVEWGGMKNFQLVHGFFSDIKLLEKRERMEGKLH